LRTQLISYNGNFNKLTNQSDHISYNHCLLISAMVLKIKINVILAGLGHTDSDFPFGIFKLFLQGLYFTRMWKTLAWPHQFPKRGWTHKISKRVVMSRQCGIFCFSFYCKL